MNYAHNNLRLKRLQNRLEKVFNLYSALKAFIDTLKFWTPTGTVELETKGKTPEKFTPVKVA